jgi:hypothetical protein
MIIGFGCYLAKSAVDLHSRWRLCIKVPGDDVVVFCHHHFVEYLIVQLLREIHYAVVEGEWHYAATSARQRLDTVLSLSVGAEDETC